MSIESVCKSLLSRLGQLVQYIIDAVTTGASASNGNFCYTFLHRCLIIMGLTVAQIRSEGQLKHQGRPLNLSPTKSMSDKSQ